LRSCERLARAAPTAAGLLLLIGAAAVLRAQEATGTASAGVYTEAQADRGKATYVKNCQSCHGDTLAGIDVAPALVGGMFLNDWVGQSLGDLADRVRTTMPQNNPGTLSSAMTADLVALILKANGYPAGAAELPRSAQVLQMIRIDAPDSTKAMPLPKQP
jgi:quinoprotein glucose dehydrogenase